MTYILDPAESSKKMKKRNFQRWLVGILMESRSLIKDSCAYPSDVS
jgi:hypothetical protein